MNSSGTRSESSWKAHWPIKGNQEYACRKTLQKYQEVTKHDAIRLDSLLFRITFTFQNYLSPSRTLE